MDYDWNPKTNTSNSFKRRKIIIELDEFDRMRSDIDKLTAERDWALAQLEEETAEFQDMMHHYEELADELEQDIAGAVQLALEYKIRVKALGAACRKSMALLSEVQANAALIAAAPDLLKRVKVLEESLKRQRQGWINLADFGYVNKIDAKAEIDKIDKVLGKND
jgi:hypothetical protein